MAKLANLARMTVSSAPGTGSTIGLNTAAIGHISFASAGISNGDVITYAIQDGNNREIGTATYSSTGPSLTGRTVQNSTSNNSPINATAGAEVFITVSASDMNEKLALTGGNLLTIYAGWPTLKIRKSGNGESNQVIGYGHTNFPRWSIELGDSTTETGTGNTGSNFALDRFDDAGTYLDSPITANRSTGLVTFASRPKFGTATPWDSANLTPSNYLLLIGGTLSGNLAFSDDGEGIVLSRGGKLADLNTGGNSNAGRTVLFANNDSFDIITENGASYILSADFAAGTITFKGNGLWHAGNLTPSDYMPKTGGVFTGTISRDGAAGTNRTILLTTSGIARWEIGAGGQTESGSNVGSLFQIARFTDAGAYVDIPFYIDRSTGQAAFSQRPGFGANTPWDSGNFTPSTKANVASPAFTGIASFGTSATLAAAGTTQGTATTITNQVSIVTSGTGGVILPAGLPVGTELKIANANLSAINVYPNSGAKFGPLATNAAFSLPSGACLTFTCGSSTYWFADGAAFV